MYYERKGGPGDARFLMHHDTGLNPYPSWLITLELLGKVIMREDCLIVQTYTGNWRTVGSGQVVLYSDTYGLWEMSHSDFKENYYESGSSAGTSAQ